MISLDGIVPVAGTYDTPGVNTRTVEETAIVFDLAAGYDPNNPITARSVGNVPTDESTHEYNSYVDALEEDGLADARIGVYRDLFGTEYDEVGGAEITAEAESEAGEVIAVIDEAIGEMEDLGATIVDPISVTSLQEFREFDDDAYYVNAEVNQNLNAYFEALGPDAPVSSVEDLYESGLYACDIAGSIEAAAEASVDTFTQDFRENAGYRKEFRDLILQTMAEEELDVILYPTMARPAGTLEEGTTGWRARTSPNADMPALSLPVGFTEDTEMPVSVDLLGRPFDETTLLQLGYSFEQGTDHRQPPDGFRELPGDPPPAPAEQEVPIAADGC